MAIDSKKFDVIGAIRGTAYPEGKVDIYTDSKTLYTWYELNALIDNNEISEPDELVAAEAKLGELGAKIKESALTFHMRGFPNGITEAINEETRAHFGDDVDFMSQEVYDWRVAKFIAASIQYVTNAAGQVDETKWTQEQVVDVRGWLPVSEYKRLVSMALDLSFAALEFDSAVSADFS